MTRLYEFMSFQKNINGIPQLIIRYIKLHKTNKNNDFIIDLKIFKIDNFIEPIYLPST